MIEIQIPVSVGELFDKISILEIKLNRIQDSSKIDNVKKEIDLLRSISHQIDQRFIKNLIKDLSEINKNLWDIEEQIRDKEEKKTYDQDFINLSRSIYIFNDKRSILKKQINLITNSCIVEEKSYTSIR